MPPASEFHHATTDRSLDAMIEMLERRGIDDRCVLAALTVIPREPFVALTGQVYDVARRVQVLQLVGDEHVLLVGVGTGYAAAVLSLLSAHVYAVESDPERSGGARTRISSLGYDGISILCGDAERGWPEHGPYDAIFVTEPVRAYPDALVEQLAVGGRLVVAIGDRLVRITRTATAGAFVTELGTIHRVEGN